MSEGKEVPQARSKGLTRGGGAGGRGRRREEGRGAAAGLILDEEVEEVEERGRWCRRLKGRSKVANDAFAATGSGL